MPAEKHSRPKSLSVEEEQFMLVYYEYKLREVCSAFYFPHKIQASYTFSKWWIITVISIENNYVL